jgi:hypothetical protein
MSLWTPGGEKPVSQQVEEPFVEASESGLSGTPEEQAAQMAELQRQLAETPAAVVIANHCFGLFELAALHLSLPTPQLSEAKLAIDALALITEGLQGRLGEGEPHLNEGLKQLRLAYVQISSADEAAAGTDAPAE